MAVSVSRVQTARPPGDQMFTITDVTCSEKYVTGGESVTAEQLGLRTLAFGIVLGLKDDGEGTVNIANAFCSVQSGNGSLKIILRDETPGEVASEAEIKKPIVQVMAFGKP